MADDEEAERITSLNTLAEKVERIEQALAKVLGGGQKETPAAGAPEPPGGIAEEVQRELSRRDDAAKQAEKYALLGKHDEVIKQLTEKTPEPPPRRVERIMGWNR
jgi:hypothetical protein